MSFPSKEMEREYNKRYYQLNKNKLKQDSKDYYQKNRAQVLAYKRVHEKLPLVKFLRNNRLKEGRRILRLYKKGDLKSYES